MRRHTQNYNYRNYSFLFPTSSAHLRNTHYQYYDRRIRTQQNIYTTTTPLATCLTPRSYSQTQPLTTISDLSEPISVLENVENSKHFQTPATPLPVIYRSQNLNRRPIISNDRFTRASIMRERLLKDIQRNINEIDQELSSLKGRPNVSRYITTRLPPLEDKREIITSRTISILNDDDSYWPNKPKRIYQVVPRITNEIIKTSLSTTPKFTEVITPDLFGNHFNYVPEVDEMEVFDDDPENTDFKSTFEEMSHLNTNEMFYVNKFRREQADATRSRALAFVPEYVDNLEARINELTDELHKSNLIDTNIIRPSATLPLPELSSISRYDNQDFQLRRQTTSEPKMQIQSEHVPHFHEQTNKTESNVTNPMLSKPIKHSHPSTNTQETILKTSQPIKIPDNNSTTNVHNVSNDVKNPFQGKEHRLSIDTGHIILATDLQQLKDDSRKNTFMREPNAVQTQQQEQQKQQQQQEEQEQKQQSIDANNDRHVEEIEKKEIAETMTDIVNKISAPTSLSPSSSAKILSISVYDGTDIQSTEHTNDSNKDQHYT